MQEMSEFAKTILNQKYSHKTKNGLETWEQVAKRVSKHVMGAVDAKKSLVKEVEQIIAKRKFIPGGRYLYSAGRQYHQTQNCLLLRAEDSREGWADLLHKSSTSLMTGAGIGIDYSDIRAEGKLIRKTGGQSTGPIALAQILNEAGRGIMQGGARRSAIWAGLNWSHPDIHKFIEMKNWRQEVRDLKAKDFNFPATMDGTNISVQLDDAFFEAYHNDKNVMHSLAHSVYWATIKQMLKTSEPGFSIDVGENKNETLRNAPIIKETWILTNRGYEQVKDIIGIPIIVWTGKRWVETVFKKTRSLDEIITITLTGRKEITCSKDHPFILKDGSRIKAENLTIGSSVYQSLGIIESGNDNEDAYLFGFCYGDGSFHKKYPRIEIPLCGNKEKLFDKILKSNIKPFSYKKDSRNILRLYYGNNELFKNRSKKQFPLDVYKWSPKSRLEFLAGLSDADGNDTNGLLRISSVNLEFLKHIGRLSETLGMSYLINKGSNGSYIGTPTWSIIIKGNISSIPCERLILKNYKLPEFKVVSIEESGTSDVYCCDVKVEEHSFQAEGIIISNCTEITSRDDSDICNLGSINLSTITSLDEMAKVVELSISFLLAGTVYSHVPYSRVDQVRTKNRRLGLGLMGIHEWLLCQGKNYGPDEELQKYLEVYQQSTKIAHKYSNEWDLSKSVKTRAIAPTGTLSIISETTGGIEPLFCAAYKRRYRKGVSEWHYQYVIDPIAKKLVDGGIDPDKIEDAYVLAEDVERRVAFQAWIQQYVDHGISSTINMPAWGSEQNNESTVRKFGDMLIQYLPKLRGMTVYADGSRSGQPLTAVPYQEAASRLGEVFVENVDLCDLTKGGSCGS